MRGNIEAGEVTWIPVEFSHVYYILSGVCKILKII